MAEQSVHDVVNGTMSVGEHSPTDAYENKSTRHSTGDDVAALEARTDNYDEQKSDQDGQTFRTSPTHYAVVNGQAIVCRGVLPPYLIFTKKTWKQSEPSSMEPSPADTFTQADSNTQDSDFDGNISRNQSVGDLSTTSDADIRKAEPLPTLEDTKNQDVNNAARRPASFKPVSFAKYSAAKVAGVNSAARSTADKGKSFLQHYNKLLNRCSAVLFCQLFYLFTTARISPSACCQNHEWITRKCSEVI